MQIPNYPSLNPTKRHGDRPIEHNVKTWPIYFQLAWDGKYKTTTRYNDRDYRVGDILIQHEYNPDQNDRLQSGYSGRAIGSVITAVFHNVPSLRDGYVLLVLDFVVYHSPNPMEDRIV